MLNSERRDAHLFKWERKKNDFLIKLKDKILRKH